MTDVESNQHVEDHKVGTTRSTIIRYFALSIHMILVLLLFLLTFFLSPSLVMISIQAFAVFGMIVYVPATIGLTARLKKTKWDRAWGEVVYLCYEAALWLANAITAGIVGGPSYCSERLYESGKTSGTRKYSYEPIGSIQIICNAMSANIALSSIQVFGLLVWIWWIYKLVTKLSLSKSEFIERKEKNLWNVSVGELMRRDIRESTLTRGSGSGKRNQEDVITPFVIQEDNNENRSDTSIRPIVSQPHTQPVIQPQPEPERDIGPYIPPPPYQNSYDNSTIPSSSSDSPITSDSSPTETNSTTPLRNTYSYANNGTSPTNNSYLPDLQFGSNDLSPTQTQTQTSLLSLGSVQGEERTSLRRALDEKQDSKDVVRRALGG